MHKIYELKENLCDMLEEYGSKGKLSASDIEIVDKLSHTVKNLDKIIEKYEEGEYSGRGYSMRDDYSMARGRTGNVRRDSMGRYSRETRDGMRYSNANDMMVNELRDLMNDAPDERTRQEFQKFISKIEMM